MASEWARRPLRDCATWFSGGTPSKNNPEYWHGSIPWISAKSLTEFFISDSEDKVTETGAENGTRLVPKNAILLIVRGMSLKSEFRMGIATRPVTFNQDLKALIALDGIIPAFLAYAIKGRTPEILSLVGEAGHGTGVLPTDRIQNLNILIPPVEEQRAIAHILGTLDDKIELNRRMNETLEAMARALFKAWFVDFEPVRAKLEGRWRRGQSLPGLPAHLYDLFPDRLVESELGEIPEGWRIEPLSDSIDFKEGPGIRNWQYTNSDDGVKFINIRCIQNGDLYLDTANRITEKEASGKYAHFNLQPWDIVVSTSGTLGRSAIVRTEHLPLVLNTSVIRFRPIDKKTSFSYVYQYLNHTEFLEKLETMASGSVQRNFGPVHLKQIVILLPSFDVMQAYEDICRPTYEQIVNYRIQSSSLARLRDTLLPKLISGELRVSDAETFMARVEHGATTNHTRRAS